MDSISIIDLNQFQAHQVVDGFYINTLKQHIIANKSLITKPHKHNSYLYILFTKGTGKHEIDFTIYDVSPGNCFMISPGKTHHWSLSEDSDGYIFTHTQDFYDLYFTHNRIQNFPFFQSVQNSSMVSLKNLILKETIATLDSILNEYHNDSILKLQKITALTDLIYIETSRVYLKENTPGTVISSSYFQKFRQFESLVESYFWKEKSAIFYADKMNISAKHLNRIAKTISGKTTSNVILERNLLEAKRKIIHSKQSFAQISYDLGFEDYAYFSKVFKDKTGKSPSDFQKSYQTL